MKKFEMILFDAGDTLIFLSPPKEQLFVDACKRLGMSLDLDRAALAYRVADEAVVTQILKELDNAMEMSDIRYQHFINDWTRTLLKEAGFEGDIEYAIHEIDQAFKICSWSWQTNNRVISTLDNIKKRGYRTAILSNFDERLPSICESLGIAERVEFLIVSSLVGFEKPDPRIFDIAREKASLRAEDILYVGDHPFDVLGAKNAGMSVAWINKMGRNLPEGISQADYEIAEVSELLELL